MNLLRTATIQELHSWSATWAAKPSRNVNTSNSNRSAVRNIRSSSAVLPREARDWATRSLDGANVESVQSTDFQDTLLGESPASSTLLGIVSNIDAANVGGQVGANNEGVLLSGTTWSWPWDVDKGLVGGIEEVVDGVAVGDGPIVDFIVSSCDEII